MPPTDPHYQPPDLVIVGAHIDHLGNGAGGSFARQEDESGGMHRGADDNASGVAGMLEVAQYLALKRKQGESRPSAIRYWPLGAVKSWGCEVRKLSAIASVTFILSELVG